MVAESWLLVGSRIEPPAAMNVDEQRLEAVPPGVQMRAERLPTKTR